MKLFSNGLLRKVRSLVNVHKRLIGNKSEAMQNKSCSNLMLEPAAEVREWLSSFDTIIADGEGVLWIYNKPIPGSINLMNRLKALGKHIYVCTNNSTQTRLQHTLKAEALGLHISENEVMCSTYATAAYLKSMNFVNYAYVIGTDALTTELDTVGITSHNDAGPDLMSGSIEAFAAQFRKEPDVGAVIVGYDAHFSFCKLAKAVTYLDDPKCLFVATNMDGRTYADNMVLPGTGCFAHAIQMCASRRPTVIGKPCGKMCEPYTKRGLIKPSSTLMIGDNYLTDVLFGRNLGFQTLLVGTGVHKWSDVLN